MQNKVDLFLDSGAFSAWTQKQDINIDEYIDFIKRNKDLIDVYANLDVIGLGGKQPNLKTAEATLDNQIIMEQAGLNPLPCFHFGEPWEFLDHYVANYDYLALGVAGNSGKKLIPWLNKCFAEHICDSQGMPKIRIHGFAVTSVYVMMKYPWYSVDSTSWVITGRMGFVFMPQWKADKWDYSITPWKWAVSTRSPTRKESGKHFETMGKEMQKTILRYCEEKGFVMGSSEWHPESQDYKLKDNEIWVEKKPKNKGQTRMVETVLVPGLANTYQLRDELNVIYFLDLENNSPAYPWAFKLEQHGLF